MKSKVDKIRAAVKRYSIIPEKGRHVHFAYWGAVFSVTGVGLTIAEPDLSWGWLIWFLFLFVCSMIQFHSAVEELSEKGKEEKEESDA